MMKFVLFYEAAENVAESAPIHFAAHAAYAAQHQAAGNLLLIGTFEDPAADGAMAILTTREGAERFAESDPFVTEGVVRQWWIQGWNEVLVP